MKGGRCPVALARIDQLRKVHSPHTVNSNDRQDLEDLLRRAAARLTAKLPERAGRQAEIDEPVKLVAAAG